MKKVTEAIVEDATIVITVKELEALNEKVTAINKVQMQIGGIEAHKHELLHTISILNSQLQTMQKELEAVYGPVNIDLKTGEISDVTADTQN